MRTLLKPRWLLFHLAAVVFIAVFLYLGWWQLGRGAAGNARSYGYAFEWPVFAGFTAFFWYRTVREELRRDPSQEAVQAVGPTPEHRAEMARRVEEEPDEEMDAYNAYLAWLDANPKRG